MWHALIISVMSIFVFPYVTGSWFGRVVIFYIFIYYILLPPFPQLDPNRCGKTCTDPKRLNSIQTLSIWSKPSRFDPNWLDLTQIDIFLPESIRFLPNRLPDLSKPDLTDPNKLNSKLNWSRTNTSQCDECSELM